MQALEFALHNENEWPAPHSLEIKEHKARNRKIYGFVIVKRKSNKIQSQSYPMNLELFLAA